MPLRWWSLPFSCLGSDERFYATSGGGQSDVGDCGRGSAGEPVCVPQVASIGEAMKKKPERARCRATCDERFAGFRRRNNRRAPIIIWTGWTPADPVSLFWFRYWCFTQRTAFVKRPSVNSGYWKARRFR